MRCSALDAIVRADVAEQRVAHAAGILDGAYGEEGETWGEYVDTLAYWERREALTSEHVGYITGSDARPRLTRQLVRLWFAEARTLPAPDPESALTFDECEAAGVDGTGRFIGATREVLVHLNITVPDGTDADVMAAADAYCETHGIGGDVALIDPQ